MILKTRLVSSLCTKLILTKLSRLKCRGLTICSLGRLKCWSLTKLDWCLLTKWLCTNLFNRCYWVWLEHILSRLILLEHILSRLILLEHILSWLVWLEHILYRRYWTFISCKWVLLLGCTLVKCEFLRRRHTALHCRVCIWPSKLKCCLLSSAWLNWVILLK